MIKPITEIAKDVGLSQDDLIQYGKHKAKINLNVLENLKNGNQGKYIIVTATTPTPLGEGKTLNAIGLSMALNKLGKKSFCNLRQPSMGPVFGIKGGGIGSGKSYILPEDEINFHFTGDFHAITYVHNLITALIYNSIYFDNPHNINTIEWHRVVDISDRTLRNITIDIPKISPEFSKTRFDITPASEIMAILALATDYNDLYRRINNVIVGFSSSKKPIYLKEFGITDCIEGLLKDAFLPNMVQTCEGTPVLVHTGPFGNIAHGASSIIADYVGLNYSDFVVTEAGFGTECGYEKFVNIKCRTSGLVPNLACIVTSLRALKYQSGKFTKKDLQEKVFEQDFDAIEKGLPNLLHHIKNVTQTNVPYLILINKFPQDKKEELDYLSKLLNENNINHYSVCQSYELGSKGTIDAAKKIIELTSEGSTVGHEQPKLKFSYDISDSIENKFSILSKNFYNSTNIQIAENAKKKIQILEENGLTDIPICVAKTQFSISCNPKRFGIPKNELSCLRDIRVFGGARFIVALTENIETMPGLPKEPLIKKYKLDTNTKKLSL